MTHLAPRSAVQVIVLSYGHTADTVACLDSLRAQQDDCEVVVIDNASPDGAAATIRSRHPWVTLIELTQNRGWAGGNNVGIRLALQRRATLVCLLNNDTVVPAGAIAALASIAARQDPCLLHPAIDYADVNEGVQLDPQRIGTPGVLVAEDPPLYQLPDAYGACLMIPASLFSAVGLLDERFFLQLEETDFWLRARRAGARSLCAPTIRITHYESRSFGARSTPAKTYYLVRNTLLLTQKHQGPLGAVRALRRLYWSIANLSARDGECRPPKLATWPFSADPHLVAARAGLRDYVLRRFGPMSAAAHRSIRRASERSGRSAGPTALNDL